MMAGNIHIYGSIAVSIYVSMPILFLASTCNTGGVHKKLIRVATYRGQGRGRGWRRSAGG